jgi:hypothetical protein
VAAIAIVNLQRPSKEPRQYWLRGEMDNAYMSAIAALAGSAIGGLASFATTWLTQHSQERAQRFAQAMTRREHLYREFIEEASKLFTDALTHQLEEPSKFVRLYALVGNLRLCASANVIVKAEEVMRQIVETYSLPNIDFRNLEDRQEYDTDVLRAFSEACREDLHV